jgi:hypothetical protein
MDMIFHSGWKLSFILFFIIHWNAIQFVKVMVVMVFIYEGDMFLGLA